MTFPHGDSDFGDLLRVVARDSGLAVALVEKDYWVTHTLWGLHEVGLDVWFKGGTSLSKGFRLIERFSEDLDVKIERGTLASVPTIANWKSTNKGQVSERQGFFAALEDAIVIPDVRVELDRAQLDRHARWATYLVYYPGQFMDELGSAFRRIVQLEVGSARVTPFLLRPLSSFVHGWLEQAGKAGDYKDNLPRAVRSVHPLVTLLEKLDAIRRRYDRRGAEASFIRHYEDAARIIQVEEKLPPLEDGLAQLIHDMVTEKQIEGIPQEDDAAFALGGGDRRSELENAYRAIAPMFWGKRVSLEASCDIIRGWLRRRHRDLPG